MYTDYFGLAENPFRITPDPRYLWYSDQHLEAKGKILYQLTEMRCPIYLLAHIGTGKRPSPAGLSKSFQWTSPRKSSLHLPETAHDQFILAFVMDEFEVKPTIAYSKSLKNFELFSHGAIMAKAYSPVLMIDEAQNMTPICCADFQHLFNSAPTTDFLIQMVLFAQPELQPKLDRLFLVEKPDEHRPLETFDLEQTKQMVQFRWTVAGGKDFPFDDDAIAEVFRITQGVPRSIVKLANEALIRTAVNQRRMVDKETVAAAAVELAIGQL